MSSISKNKIIKDVNIGNIMNHNDLHEIFNGSARITKRVAEFANSESIHIKHINKSKDSHQLTLDEISLKYPKSAFAKNDSNQYQPQQLLTVDISMTPKNKPSNTLFDQPHFYRHQIQQNQDNHIPTHKFQLHQIRDNHSWNESIDYDNDFGGIGSIGPTEMTPVKPEWTEIIQYPKWWSTWT